MIKNWILNLSFVKKAINMASMEGTDFGKSQADVFWKDRVDTLVQQKVSALLSAVDERNIITLDKKAGVLFVGGERLNEPTILSLKSEAEFLKNSELWKIMNESLKDQAHKAMFERSVTFDDMKTGKSMLYTLSFQNKIIDIFKSHQPKATPRP